MTPPPSPNLPELLARVRHGDEAALAQLLQHYELPLRRTAHVLLGPVLRNQCDTGDLVQSVHRMLLPGLRAGKYNLERPEQLLALAVMVVRNKIISKWRRARTEERTTQGAAEAALARQAARLREDDPAAATAMREGVERLLGTLLPADRLLIELLLEGFTPAEAAVRLGCDAHALRARLSRLRQRLARQGFADLLGPD